MDEAKRRVTEALILAQAPAAQAPQPMLAGMQRAIIEMDPNLYGGQPKGMLAPPVGQPTPGQVGQTSVPANKLRGLVQMLMGRGLSQRDAEAMAQRQLQAQGLSR